MTDGLKDVHRKAIIAAIAANDRVERAVLFGSRATGTNTVSSDVDIALFGDRLTLTDQARLAAALDELPMAQRVDLLLYEAVDNPALREQIERHGVEWYRRSQGMVETRIVEGAGDQTTPQSPPSHESLGKNKSIEMPITKAVKVNPTIKLNRGDKYAFVEMADLNGISTRVRPSNTKEFKGSGARFLHGDTLFARITPCLENGKIAKYLGTIGEAGFGSTEFIVFRGRDGITTTDYAHYLATDPNFRSFAISKMTGSSGRQRVPVDALESYIVQIPPIEQQSAIAHILGTLDDKIEVNRRMNATLEAMVRAIFKDWFVDFGPTRAKMEGRDPYLAPKVWDLFPDKLDEEGKPVRWKWGSLATIADSPRHSVSPVEVADNTPYIGLEHMPRRSIALTEWEGAGKVASNKSIFKKGEFLFGKLRPYFHKVGFTALDGICSTDIVVVTPRASEWATFTLACLSSDEFVDYTDQTSTGTKMPRTSWKSMRQYKVCLPPGQVAHTFQGLTQPLIDRMNAHILGSCILAQTRDLLLPRLTSGEIDISDANNLIEEIA